VEAEVLSSKVLDRKAACCCGVELEEIPHVPHFGDLTNTSLPAALVTSAEKTPANANKTRLTNANAASGTMRSTEYFA